MYCSNYFFSWWVALNGIRCTVNTKLVNYIKKNKQINTEDYHKNKKVQTYKYKTHNQHEASTITFTSEMSVTVTELGGKWTNQ